jgi:FkbM family methyltransferase
MRNSVFAQFVLRKVLGLSRVFRREILRDPFLLEIKRWFRDKGDSVLRLEYPLGRDSIVVDLGGYHGDFAAAINQRYGCKVFIFEPMPSYFGHCVTRFHDNSEIRSFCYGLAAKAGWFDISDSDDASSFIRTGIGVSTVKAELRQVAEVFREIGLDRIDLLKINIEGGEFDVLQALIDSGLVEKVRFIQVQFHDFFPDAAVRRDQIRQQIARTHRQMWSYTFVWESWERI